MEKHTILLLLIVSSASAAIVVPQEISTLIDFILKFLPSFKKGTEQSRIGFGFSFGNQSDFQTVVQFGPDKEKQNDFAPSTVTKRRASKLKKEKKAQKLNLAKLASEE